MNDIERIEILRRYDFGEHDGTPRKINPFGFGGKLHSITMAVDLLCSDNRPSQRDTNEYWGILYHSIGFMLTRYIANPASELPDDSIFDFLRQSEIVVFRLAQEIDAFSQAFYHDPNFPGGSSYATAIHTSVDELIQINTPTIKEIIASLESKLS